MTILAHTYIGLGRFREAIELIGKAIELKKHVLGSEHPDTLISMANLAYNFKIQGTLSEATELLEIVIELQTKFVGYKHPDTLACMGVMAHIYKDQGRLGEAVKLMERTIELQTKTLGSEHYTTLTVMADLASMYPLQEAKYLEVETEKIRSTASKAEIPDAPTGKGISRTNFSKDNPSILSTASETGEKGQGIEGGSRADVKRLMQILEAEFSSNRPLPERPIAEWRESSLGKPLSLTKHPLVDALISSPPSIYLPSIAETQPRRNLHQKKQEFLPIYPNGKSGKDWKGDPSILYTVDL